MIKENDNKQNSGIKNVKKLLKKEKKTERILKTQDNGEI